MLSGVDHDRIIIDEFLLDTIEHDGVKGMKWGVVRWVERRKAERAALKAENQRKMRLNYKKEQVSAAKKKIGDRYDRRLLRKEFKNSIDVVRNGTPEQKAALKRQLKNEASVIELMSKREDFKAKAEKSTFEAKKERIDAVCRAATAIQNTSNAFLNIVNAVDKIEKLQMVKPFLPDNKREKKIKIKKAEVQNE